MNKDLLSPCGLYCGACGILIADRTNDNVLKGKLAKAYGVAVDDIRCSGCLSEKVFVYCRVCAIKKCSSEKGYEGCYQCDAFPCEACRSFSRRRGQKDHHAIHTRVAKPGD